MAFKWIRLNDERLMPGLLSETVCPDQLFNRLYNAGYRLTGSHQDASKLIELTIEFYGRNGKSGKSEALNCLCKAFIETTAGKNEGHNKSAFIDINESSNNEVKIQCALLSLTPIERLMVVLRDILALDYTATARTSGFKETDVKRKLATARQSLRKRLHFYRL